MRITTPTEEFRMAAERVQFHPKNMTLTPRGDLWIVPIAKQRELLSTEAIELMRLFNSPAYWGPTVSRAKSIGRRIHFERGPAFWWLRGPLLVDKENEMVIAIVLPKPLEPPSGAHTTPEGPPTSPDSGTPAGRPPPQERRKTNEAITRQSPTVNKEQKNEAIAQQPPATPRERLETQNGKEIAVSALKRHGVMISKVIDGRESVESHTLEVGCTLEFYEKEGIQRNVGMMLAVMVYSWEKLVAGS